MSLFECRCRRLRQLLALALQLVAVDAERVHIPGVAYQHLELAVRKLPGLDTDKGVPQLVESDARRDTVAVLILLPPPLERPLAGNLKQGRVVVELDARVLEELHLSLVCFPGLLAHIKATDAVFIFARRRLVLDVDTPPEVDGVALYISVPKADQLTGAQARRDGETVGIDIIIKDMLDDDGAVAVEVDAAGGSLVNFDLDLLGCKKYVKATVSVVCTGGSSPSCTATAALALGDADEVPV